MRLTRRSLLKFPAYVGTLPAASRKFFLSGRLDPAPVGLALGALAAIASAILLFRVHVEEERSNPARALPRSPCRCRLGGNRRGQLIGGQGLIKARKGRDTAGATRLAPEAARTCEGCEAMPEQSVGDNRATQLIGAQRRVKARVRALAALNQQMLGAGKAGRLSGRGWGRALPNPEGVSGVPWN